MMGAFAELHYTDFGDVETFESLADRHGLKYIGRDVAAGPGATCFLYSDGDSLELWMASDPTTGEHRDKPDPETGYASYTFIRGPREKAERLFRDVIDTAPYIKGEFQPLQTEDGDEIVSYWDIEDSTSDKEEGMRCSGCDRTHTYWSKKGKGSVDDGHNSGIIVAWKCGRCGNVEEVLYR